MFQTKVGKQKRVASTTFPPESHSVASQTLQYETQTNLPVHQTNRETRLFFFLVARKAARGDGVDSWPHFSSNLAYAQGRSFFFALFQLEKREKKHRSCASFQSLSVLTAILSGADQGPVARRHTSTGGWGGGGNFYRQRQQSWQANTRQRDEPKGTRGHRDGAHKREKRRGSDMHAKLFWNPSTRCIAYASAEKEIQQQRDGFGRRGHRSRMGADTNIHLSIRTYGYKRGSAVQRERIAGGGGGEKKKDCVGLVGPRVPSVDRAQCPSGRNGGLRQKCASRRQSKTTAI